MPLSRRRFLGQAALVTGAAFCPGWLRGSAADKDLLTRTAAARQRYARVAAFINRAHPELRREIVASADEAMRGLLHLPGSAGLSDVGNPPAWTTPRYGDEEYLWAINRMMHWKTLLQAHALTGEERYAAKVVAELDDWIVRTAPPPWRRADGSPHTELGTNAGPPPWRVFETGMRMYDVWPVVLEQLAGTPFLPPERLARMTASAAQHGEEISLLSPLLWPEADHNHYFIEMLGLLGVTVYYPNLPQTAEWSGQAMRELQRCLAKQFTADGGHVEACPSYHNLCVILLARFLGLARAAGRELPASYAQLLASATDQTLHGVRPTGGIVPWGDSSRQNQVEAALWATQVTGDLAVLQHLVGLMGREKVQTDAAPHLWIVDDPEALFAGLSRSPSPRPLVRVDRGNDQVMMRSSWQRDALSLFFSCHSPLVPGSGHQHIDLGGFDFTAYGKTLVADPGVFTYREDADRKTFKSAEYHSVLTIDGKGPFEYVSRWRYTPQKEGRVTAVTEDAGHVRIASFHRNYEPAVCERAVALVDGRFLVVVDVVDGIAPDSTVQIYFHVDSTKVETPTTGPAVQTQDADVQLAIHLAGGLQTELLPGRISDAFDTARPSTRMRFSDRGGASRRVYAAVLVPATKEKAAPQHVTVETDDVARVCRVALDGQKFVVKYGASPK